MKPIIYLDLDGVLCDFVGGVLTAAGRPYLKTANSIHGGIIEDTIGEERMWELLQDIEFWANLKPYPWAKEIFDMCFRLSKGRVKILSKGGKRAPNAYTGKILWVKKHLGDIALEKINLCSGSKADLAGPNRFLIDDFDVNIKEWEAEKGRTFHWKLRGPHCEERKVRQDIRHLSSELVGFMHQWDV